VNTEQFYTPVTDFNCVSIARLLSTALGTCCGSWLWRPVGHGCLDSTFVRWQYVPNLASGHHYSWTCPDDEILHIQSSIPSHGWYNPANRPLLSVCLSVCLSVGYGEIGAGILRTKPGRKIKNTWLVGSSEPHWQEWILSQNRWNHVLLHVCEMRWGTGARRCICGRRPQESKSEQRITSTSLEDRVSGFLSNWLQ